MRHFYLTTIFLFSIGAVFSQKTKTVYLDYDWQKIKQDKAEYYRQITKNSEGNYVVRDYYMSGQLQMSGMYSDKKFRYSTGEFNYYDSIGNLEKTCFYVNDDLDGTKLEYHSNGQLKIFTTYDKGVRNGIYREFYEDSTLRAEAKFVNGTLRGKVKRYHTDRSVLLEMNTDEKGDGKMTAYYENGDIREEGTFKGGKRFGTWNTYNLGNEFLKSRKYEETVHQEEDSEGTNAIQSEVLVYELFDGYNFGNEENFGVVYYPDVEAGFPGGPKALQKYINANVIYPEKAIIKNVEGRVFLSFVVEPDGSISNIKVENGPRLLKSESIRVIKNMPNWNPGTADTKKVRTRCRLPIVYRLT